MKNVVARVRLMTMAQKSRACPCLASAMPQYAQEASSASLAASTSSTASTSSSNSGITSGSPATGITGPAPYLPYRLHREWRIGDVVLEDSLISRIDIRNGSFRVERDSLGGASLACYRHVTDYLGSVRTVYRMGTSWVLTPVQHITYMPSGAVLANSDGDVQQRMFCGKELQPLHGWKMYDSHARMQYNVLPRFSSTDPLCQKYYHLSPYAYCANDPVNMVDPEGKEPTEEEAARIAAHVYEGKVNLIGGWKISQRLENIINLSDEDGLNSHIYEREKNGNIEYVYATAGTEINNIEDWCANVSQIAGLSSQYHKSVIYALSLSKFLGKEKELNYVGHSLGGGLAAINSLVTSQVGYKGRKAFTFNAAGVSLATKIREGGFSLLFKSERNIHSFITYNDPLNILQNNNATNLGIFLPDVNGVRHYRFPSKIAWFGHSIDNFTD